MPLFVSIFIDRGTWPLLSFVSATWPLFCLHAFYMNGHNLLAHKLIKRQLTGCRTTRSLKSPILKLPETSSDRINPQGLHKVLLDVRQIATVPFRNLSGWVIPGRFSIQIECATDIAFRKPEYLAPIWR